MNFKNRASVSTTIIVLSGILPSDGFLNARQRSSPVQKRSQHHKKHAVSVDLSPLLQHDLGEYQISATTNGAGQLDVLMSTMYSTGLAHGHSNPWFGPPDPYLEAGRSIAPRLPMTPTIGGDGEPVLSSTLPQRVQEMIAKGDNVIDAATIKDQQQLPGFVPSSFETFSIHETVGMGPTYLASFQAKAEWAISFVNVFDKLVLASFVYCLVEFFFLRRNVDLYKAEIEQETPASLLVDVLATFTVRFVALGFLALLTLVIFL